MIGLKNDGLELNYKEELTMLNNRLKNEGLELTLSNDQLKNEGGIRHC